MAVVDDLFSLVDLSDRPDLIPQSRVVTSRSWAKFMSLGAKHWPTIQVDAADYQQVLLDRDGTVVATSASVPFCATAEDSVQPSGWDEAFIKAHSDYMIGRPPTATLALGISVHPDYRGRGVALRMLRGMTELAEARGFRHLFAPVRPSSKHRYPLVAITDYLQWCRNDGSAFDPWIREHVSLGAHIVGAVAGSLVIEGPVAEWEEALGSALPQSGAYVIKDGLAPLFVDVGVNRCRYSEPNIWMRHDIKPEPCEYPHPRA